jgi:hypothetical protein
MKLFLHQEHNKHIKHHILHELRTCGLARRFNLFINTGSFFNNARSKLDCYEYRNIYNVFSDGIRLTLSYERLDFQATLFISIVSFSIGLIPSTNA